MSIMLPVETSDPNLIIFKFLIGGLVLVGFWRFIVSIRDAPETPDPWSAEIAAALEQPDAAPICHRCLTPHSNQAWFCEHCGNAVGPYNNVMPYVGLFSQGEVFRNGVTDKMRASPLIIIGYLIYSSSNYFIFAPIYWFFFFKNLKRGKEFPENEEVK